ncbi:hypothetical protein HN935_02275 [archaeon]|jgi:hypothetical protein|nr:hypothetical protein [archaeon]
MDKNKFIFLFIVIGLSLSLVSAIESEQTYVFRVVKDGLYVSPVSLDLFDSPFSEQSNLNKGEYHADLVSNEKVLYSLKFDLYSLSMTNPTEECFENPEDVSCQEDLYIYDYANADVILNFPYYKSANAINVYNENGLIFRFDFENETTGFFMQYWYYFVAGVILLVVIVFLLKRKKNPTLQNQRFKQTPRYN